MFKFLLGCLIILTSAFVLVFYVFKPQFTLTPKGISLVTPITEAMFFVPANSPIKVYKFDPHPSQITKIVQSDIIGSDAKFGVYVKNLTTNQEYDLNGDSQIGSASLFKLFIMYTIYQKAAQGKLDINAQDIQENLQQMIEVSSNEAAYYLVDNYTSWEEVDTNMKQLGLSNTDLINPSQIPQTTPKDVGKLLELIAESKAVDQKSSQAMTEFMSNQQRRDRIPALLPDNIFIVNKTGELDDIRNDAAIIGTPNNDYILVLMSYDSQDPEAVKPVMAKISKDIYDFFENEWINPPEII